MPGPQRFVYSPGSLTAAAAFYHICPCLTQKETEAEGLDAYARTVSWWVNAMGSKPWWVTGPCLSLPVRWAWQGVMTLRGKRYVLPCTHRPAVVCTCLCYMKRVSSMFPRSYLFSCLDTEAWKLTLILLLFMFYCAQWNKPRFSGGSFSEDPHLPHFLWASSSSCMLKVVGIFYPLH